MQRSRAGNVFTPPPYHISQRILGGGELMAAAEMLLM
jgi:hypothetical protein